MCYRKSLPFLGTAFDRCTDQFGVGTSTWSITRTTTGPFVDSSLSPNCPCIAVKIKGPEESDAGGDGLFSENEGLIPQITKKSRGCLGDAHGLFRLLRPFLRSFSVIAVPTTKSPGPLTNDVSAPWATKRDGPARWQTDTDEEKSQIADFRFQNGVGRT